MRNTKHDADDTPEGTCFYNSGGYNECPRWPDMVPSPCCWLSCTELCGAACYRPDTGERCSDYGEVAM